jgi:hypothetical protein
MLTRIRAAHLPSTQEQPPPQSIVPVLQSIVHICSAQFTGVFPQAAG